MKNSKTNGSRSLRILGLCMLMAWSFSDVLAQIGMKESDHRIMKRKCEETVGNYYAVLNLIGSPESTLDEKETYIDNLMINTVFSNDVSINNDLSEDGVDAFAARDYFGTILSYFPQKSGVEFNYEINDILGPYLSADEYVFYRVQLERQMSGINNTGVVLENDKDLDFYVRFEKENDTWLFNATIYDVRAKGEIAESTFEEVMISTSDEEEGLFIDCLSTHEQFLALFVKNEKFGFICSINNSTIIPAKYDWAFPFHNGLALVKLDGKYGFIDFKGREVVPIEYDFAYPFYESLTVSRKNKKWFLINRAGEVINTYKAHWMHPFTNNSSKITSNKFKTSFVDNKGRLLFDLTSLGSGNSRMTRRETFWQQNYENKKFVIRNKRNRVLEEKEYDYMYFSYRDGDGKYNIFRKYYNYGFVNDEGIEISIEDDVFVTGAWFFSEGLAKVEIKERTTERYKKWGFIDTSGHFVISPKYDFVSSFSNGIASAYMYNSNPKFIDSSNNEVFKINATSSGSFKQGLCPVKIDGRWGYIDIKGNLVIHNGFEEAYTFWNGFALVKKNDKWGLINTKGELVIENKYDLKYFLNIMDLAIASDFNVLGTRYYVNSLGSCVINCP